MQSQVRFNRVPEKVWEALVQPGQVQQGSGFRGYGEGSGERPGQGGHSTHPAEVFPALGFAACFTKIGKNKTMRLLRIPPKLIFRQTQMADIHREPPQADLKPKSDHQPGFT